MMAQTGQPLLGASAFRYVAGGFWLGGVAACGRGHGCARQNEGDDGNKERTETKGHWVTSPIYSRAPQQAASPSRLARAVQRSPSLTYCSTKTNECRISSFELRPDEARSSRPKITYSSDSKEISFEQQRETPCSTEVVPKFFCRFRCKTANGFEAKQKS